MKKILNIILISICIIAVMVGCNKTVSDDNTKTYENKDSEEIIKIMENVYVDYINDIYLDSSKYIGKTIEIEGMFTQSTDEDNKNHLYVYRITDIMEHTHEEDSECENHEVESMLGLEFSYNGNLPNENEWIKVVGTLEEQDGNLIINADSVEIVNERGLEKVNKLYQ